MKFGIKPASEFNPLSQFNREERKIPQIIDFLPFF